MAHWVSHRLRARRGEHCHYIEPPRPKVRRFYGNHHGCVAGRETLGVTLLTRHRLFRQQFPGVQPDYALTLPGGERDDDTCYFYTSDSHATFFDWPQGFACFKFNVLS